MSNQNFSDKEIYASIMCLIAFMASPTNSNRDYKFDYQNFLGISAVNKLVEALARDNQYNEEMPSYEDIFGISSKILDVKQQLEDFLLVTLNKLHPFHGNFLKCSTLSIVGFEEYCSKANLNKTGRHRALNLERLLLEKFSSQTDKNKDWYTPNLFIGWIYYVIISVLREYLNQKSITYSWNMILESFSSQKLKIVSGRNFKGKELSLCKSSEASITAQGIYKAFGFEENPSLEF